MGCKGLLAKPWNLRAEATLREFLFERGNQWIRTMRQEPEKWTSEVWAGVYGFPKGKGEGWAGRRDSYYIGKFRTDPDPKDGFHPGNCRNPRERRVIEFILPILSLEKPKRLSVTMANTLFGAMSGARPVNWGRLIQEYVEKSIPHIGWKPSFLSPYILHLYQHHGCINEEEEDMLTIAEDEVVYKISSEVEVSETGTEIPATQRFWNHLRFCPLQRSGNPPHHRLNRKLDPAGKFLGRTLTSPPLSFRKPPSSASGMR